MQINGANSYLDTAQNINGAQVVIPCDPSQQNCQCDFNPNKTVYKAACIFPIGCYTINSVLPDNCCPMPCSDELAWDQIRCEIFNYGDVVAGYQVYQSFYDFFNPNTPGYNPKAIYPGSTNSDQLVGGHAIVLIGWGVSTDKY